MRMSSHAVESGRLVFDARSLRDRACVSPVLAPGLEGVLQRRKNERPATVQKLGRPPETVLDAVRQAKQQYASALIFGTDVMVGVAQLAPNAGPPEKVLAYFGHLAEMTVLRQTVGLGAAPIKWFQKRGVDCSGESRIHRNSTSEQRKRTWNDGTGSRVFEQHLKPSEATHPDRCVRIYFDYDESLKRCIIGWVGRHP